jgi:hypothetical protein
MAAIRIMSLKRFSLMKSIQFSIVAINGLARVPPISAIHDPVSWKMLYREQTG